MLVSKGSRAPLSWSARGAAALLATLAVAPLARAKGLEELSQSNPETEAAAEKSKEAGGTDAAAAAAPAAAMAPTALSRSLADKLFIAPGFAWVIATKPTGSWKSAGMSDVTVGYKLPMALSGSSSVAATYRYAPVAVSGTEDGHSYRGVWETHYFGGRFTYPLSSTLHALGSAELGYVRVGLEELDGLDADHKHERGGGALAVGGGADWSISDKFASSGGPRAFVGFGSFTTVQIGGAFSFLF